jgi:hypothetical protein
MTIHADTWRLCWLGMKWDMHHLRITFRPIDFRSDFLHRLKRPLRIHKPHSWEKGSSKLSITCLALHGLHTVLHEPSIARSILSIGDFIISSVCISSPRVNELSHTVGHWSNCSLISLIAHLCLHSRICSMLSSFGQLEAGSRPRLFCCSYWWSWIAFSVVLLAAHPSVIVIDSTLIR